MALKKVGERWWLDVEVRGKRWRGPIAKYVIPRMHDAVWRAQCRLPDGACLSDKRILERHVEPQAALDWAAFVAGTGPDPRKPPTKAGASDLFARDVVERWFHYRVNDPERPLTATYSTEPRVRFVQKWLGERPASDLLTLDLYADFQAHIAARGASRYAGSHYIASVLRPSVYWAAAQSPALLVANGPLPFGRHRVRTATSKKRTRVISAEEAESIMAALSASTHPDAARVRLYVLWLRATGCRPWELCLLQSSDINWRRNEITLRAETTKSGRERVIPFDPTSEAATLLQPMRFTKGAYVFAKVQPDGSRNLKRIGSDLSDTMRYRWVEAVAAAGLSNAGIVIRDWRRTTATDWRTGGLPKDDRSYLLGHGGDITDRYSLADLDGLRERMARHVWSSQRQADTNHSAVA